MFIRYFFITITLILTAGCSLQDSSSSQKKDPRMAKLYSHKMPAKCDFKKIFVFKVVCDQNKNMFGIDQSFIEAICQSELEMLEGLPQETVYKFLNDRIDYFNNNWAAVKESSDYPFLNELRNVKITAFVKNNFSNSVVCVLNNGDDHIEVNADVVPDCTNSDGTFRYGKCGVDVNNIRVSNNGYSISKIRISDEGSTNPIIAHKLTSGFIYQGFFPEKKSNYSFSDYYSDDPTEKGFYLRKDSRGILDKYI